MSNYTSKNLITYSSTIQSNQRLIKRKDSTFLPIDIAIVDTNILMDFYKCASVFSADYYVVFVLEILTTVNKVAIILLHTGHFQTM